MTRHKLDKKILALEPKFKDILVCQEGKAAPFMEIFIGETENIAQQNLGTIAGIFEITDENEDSSYIVNYLISVIKKEYFSNTKRGAIESFEAALHKANLALAKLAEHGNIKWIGHFNAACAVIEKNNIHFSQTGTASIFLLRSKSLTNISESSEEIPDPNPLKTFQDVVSGRVEKDDKLIMTTESIFNIFSFEEIKRSALRFKKDEFTQFLKTALVNELDRAAVLVIDIAERETKEAPITVKKTRKINAFSQVAFTSKKQASENNQNLEVQKEPLESEERKSILKGLKEEYEKTKGEFVDKKTGHIYIKEDGLIPQKESHLQEIRNYGGAVIGQGEKFLFSLKKKAKLTAKSSSDEDHYLQTEKTTVPTNQRENISQKKSTSWKEKLIGSVQKTASLTLVSFSALKSTLTKSLLAIHQKALLPLTRAMRSEILKIFSKRTAFKEKFNNLRLKKKSPSEPDQERTAFEDYLSKTPTREEKRTWFKALSKNAPELEIPNQPIRERYFSKKPLVSVGKILPNLSKMKNIFSSLDYTKKAYVALIVLLIFVVPYFIVKIESNFNKKKEVQGESVQSSAPPLEQDKNVSRIESLDAVYQSDSSLGIINLNGKFFAVGKSEIGPFEQDKKYAIPEKFLGSELAAGMNDLNLIFLIKNKAILSFSPTSGKFSENNIVIPSDATVTSAKSYLTYLYLLDGKNSQIYRYPRAEGGFGEKTNWLRDSADLSDAQDMAISDNVYVLEEKTIVKFFRGKKQDFTLESSTTPVLMDKIYARPDGQYIFALDHSNSRIVRFSLDGNIISQYHHPEIGMAKGFSVDEENNVIYVSGESGVKSFGMD